MGALRRGMLGAPRPTGRGWAVLVVGVALVLAAFALHTRGLLLPGLIAVAMPLLALAWVALRRPVVEVARVFEHRMLPVGETTEVQLQLRNRARRRIDGASWRDEMPDELLAQPTATLPTVAASGSGAVVRLAYRIEADRRGVAAIGPLRLVVHDPFGLARAASLHGPSSELVVTPRVPPLSGASHGGAGGDGTVHTLTRRSLPNADELIAREYRRGDPYRRVHWRATARAGELMVRQEEQAGDPEAVLVLDTGTAAFRAGGWRLGLDGTLEAQGFELAVEAAAGLGVRLLRDGFRVQLLRTVAADGGPGGLHGAAPEVLRGVEGGALLLDALARLSPPARAREADPDAPARLPGRRDLERPPAFAVLVDPEPRCLDALVALAPRFGSRTALLVGPLDRAAREALAEADWRLVDVAGPGEVQRAWETARSGAEESADAG